MSNQGYEQELRSERAHLSFLYTHLEAAREAAAGRTADAVSLWERDVAVTFNQQEVQRLKVADDGLCFGRLDERGGERRYIGRIGLFEEDYEPVLLDWRAPAARPFYCATGANPEGMRRRRQFHTIGRRLVEFTDELLEGESSVDGTALLAALDAPRDGVMRDIVATIQAEQDEIIRLDHPGVVVIEGGPGTGKTAVALHRVAYLLYTKRKLLSRSGVLVIGPNPRFLGYIDRVLPSLGETDVVFATPADLFPGLRPTAEETPEAREIKGSAAMVHVLREAIADRQRLPVKPIMVKLDDVTVPVDTELVEPALKRAQATGLPHNEARSYFWSLLEEAFVERAVDLIGQGWLLPGDRMLRAELVQDVTAELVTGRLLERAVDELWPRLSPYQLLRDLFTSPERLDVAAPFLRDALYRADGEAWTSSDVALLDEATELLGQHTTRELKEEREFAEGVLEILNMEDDGETLRAQDVVTASQLAERHVEHDTRALAERAASDREWTYGHVVVDEAQELSEMDWRMLMRRCPRRSFTIVGDLAQRESPAGARDWEDMLAPHVQDRWKYRALTTNYRTPAEIMEVAAAVLAEVDPAARPPRSVRAKGIRPWARHVENLTEAVARAVREASGSVAVIAPPGVDVGHPAMTPRESKGLEFDSVILVEPGQIGSASDLYVALTRATQRLGVLHTEPLPATLRSLEPRYDTVPGCWAW
ncbi:DNA helicase IV [Amycolatopsis xylanica]|uniref:DNA helicase IV n=1 Tax=Amycolatopsis xylanica TaxID=589385 RepID=A0A1H2ZTQ7_9PSEU|nr:AAA family ATPase [Amycolatopsis xylanica]SDX20706.1 DNA helicase IV [Amycolatopsis xylanica]